MNKRAEGTPSSNKFVSLAVLCTFIFQISLVLASYSLNAKEDMGQRKLLGAYSTWHVDTDLQFMSNILGVEGNQNIGLSLVTAKDPKIEINQINRFNPEISGLISTPYLSSSGLFEISSNWLYERGFKDLLNPKIYLIWLRFLLITLSYLGYYFFLMMLANSLQTRFFPLITLFFLFNPWLFLDSTSLFWSPAIRYAPIFYLCYLCQKKQGRLNLARRHFLILATISIASTFNGFEMTTLVVGIVSIWLLISSERNKVGKYLYLVFFTFVSILGGLFAWFIVLVQQLNGQTSTAMSVFRYTLFKHSNLKVADALPMNVLESSDPNVNLFSALFRITARTSLVLPYDLMIIFRGEGELTQIMVFFFVTMTSFLVLFILVVSIMHVPLKISGAFLLLLLTWVISIKSYVFHHVHILGSVLLLFTFMIAVSPRLERRSNAHNSF
jgi:hypothetical protein